MGFIRIGPNGEISLPREAWDALGLKPGDRVELVTDPASRSVTLHPPAPSSPAHRRRADALFGCLPPPPRPLTLDEMDAAIADAIRERNTPR